MSNFFYVIPPYLLNTCLGCDLQNKLALCNEDLSTLNVISSDSKYFHNRSTPKKPLNTFSRDPILNEIIKIKVFYKLSSIGVLGANPKEFNLNDSELLYEYYSMLENKLLIDQVENETDSDKFDYDHMSPSIFQNTENEEAIVKVPSEYAAYMNKSLKELVLEEERLETERVKRSCSFVKFDDSTYFGYPLPISWVPFTQAEQLGKITDQFNMKIDCDNGFSNISMFSATISTDKSEDEDDDNESDDGAVKTKTQSTKYYNFITEKPINSSTGIYYYEVEVEQEVTAATDFQTIISMNDNSLSSDCSLSLSTGFIKRFVAINKANHAESNHDPSYFLDDQSSAPSSLDLEDLKRDLRKDIKSESFDASLLPGEINGSFAVNFEDSYFYNSIKASESKHQTAILSMNRRLSSLNRESLNDSDFGKVDIGVPFKTHLMVDTSKKKVYKTDVIGCGINFINKSIFITLNGVLVKVIAHEELVSSQPSSNNLFAPSRTTGLPPRAREGADASRLVAGRSTATPPIKSVPDTESSKGDPNAVYPIIGFKLSEGAASRANHESSKAHIKSNFGFKEFKFNISNYVNSFKLENQKFLYLSLLEKIESNKLVGSSDSSSDVSKAENSLLNLNSDSKMLNSLIKGYLNHQGYLETFKSFSKDLRNLEDETKHEPGVALSETSTIDEDIQDSKDEEELKQSHAVNRNVIKSYLLANKYDSLFKFLKVNYPRILTSSVTIKDADGCTLDLSFEVKLLKFTYILRNYIERKLNFENVEFEFEFSVRETETELYDKALRYRQELQSEYDCFPEQMRRINELSSVLLVNDQEGLNNLPKVIEIFNNYPKSVIKLCAQINVEILRGFGINGISKLEQIFENVHDNIRSLSFDAKDDKFMLVNFDRDYLDL